MEVVPLSPIYLQSLTWRRDTRSWMLTVVAKATLDLLPGEMRLSQQADPIHEADQYWEDDPERSVYAPGDLAPYKPRVDVSLVGHAFVPRGTRARSLVARMTIGMIDKSVSVYGDRTSASRNEPAPFARMALRYERAAGGPGTANPAGVAGNVDRLPNVEPKGGRDDGSIPAGFGPIPPGWPLRSSLLPQHASFSPDEPLDDGIDPGFFCCAPPDQQLPALRSNEQVTLENLHPDHARLVTRLPGLRPQAFVERPHVAPQELDLHADSLWIDTDRGRCTVTWRGQVQLTHREEAGRVLVALVNARQKLTWDDVRGLDQALRGDRSAVPAAPPPPAQPPPAQPKATRGRPGLPVIIDEESEGEAGMTISMLKATQSGAEARSAPALPFSPPVPATPPPAHSPPTLSFIPALPTIPRPMGAPTTAEEAKRAAAAPARQATPAPTAAPPPQALHAPVAAASPPPVPRGRPPTRPGIEPAPVEPARGMYDSNEPTSTDLFAFADLPQPDAAPLWLTPTAPRGAAPAMPAVPPVAPVAPPASPQAVAFPFAVAPVPPAPVPVPPPPPVSAPAPAPPAMAKASPTLEGFPALVEPHRLEPRSPWAAPGGVVAAPMIAAPAAPVEQVPSASVVTRAPREASSEVTDLLWFDPAAMARVRSRFGAIVDELEFEPLDPQHDLPVDDPAASRDRHHAFGVLTRAEATDGPGVTRAMMEAVSDRGRFTPPLVVLSGELRFPLDEVEMLKVATAAAKPLAKDDKRLTDLLESLNEIVGTPLIHGASGMIDGLMKELQAAVQQARRPLPIKYLDTHIERVLLEQRKYQKKQVFGGACIRALLLPGRDGAPIPTYLPESLADKLPLVTQMKVRLIAEANPSQDQYESHGQALRVVVLGRVMAMDGLRR